MTDWKNVLFDEGEIIAFKEVLTDEERAQGKWVDPYNKYVFSGERFFCINPMKERLFGRGGGNADNVAVYRNILIEWDLPNLSAKQQMKRAEKYGIPFATATFSGGKSVHFIISLKEPFITAQAYNKTAAMLALAFGMDESTSNVNRLSRTPGAFRAPGIEQRLLAVGERISNTELIKWFTDHPAVNKKVAKARAAIAAKEQLSAIKKLANEGLENSKTILPRIYTDMLISGALHPNTNSRHDSLIKFGSWLKANWHDESEVEELLYRAADAMGIGGRGDVEGVLRWLGL